MSAPADKPSPLSQRRWTDCVLRPDNWLMTNFWETNFEASLGGFHEFNYRLEWGPHITTPAQGVDLCRALNHGIGNFRTSVPP